MTSKSVVAIEAPAAARATLGATIDQTPETTPRRGTTLRHRPWWPLGRPRTLRVPARGLGVATAIAGLLITGVAFATPAAATTSGYTLANAQIIGESPTGFKVYVSPSSHDHATIAWYSSRIAGQLHNYGLPVRYAGYGNPAKVRGIITVSEGSRGCSGSSTTLANTYWHYAAMPGGYYMYRSDIVICAARYAHLSVAQRAAVLRHEFGHTMGLGHTNYSYRGTYQMMNAYLHSSVRTYEAGDIAGLKRLAAGTAIVRSRVS